MKPHITQGWTGVWLGAWIHVRGWHCSGGGRTSWGATPKQAYDEWMKPVWTLDVVIEQPTPKPSWWKTFKSDLHAIWTCDIFARVGVA